MKNQLSNNFHQNFLDLNPEYNKQRHMRAIRIANRLLEELKYKFKGKVDE